MRTVAGTPCAFSAAWKAQRTSLQGAKTGESAAWVAEMILSWSRLSLGGFQPQEVRPQLRKFCEPLGCWSLAPLEPQLPELKPKRPPLLLDDDDDEEEDDDDDEDEDEEEEEFEFELELELLLLSEDDCELLLPLEPELELDLESELDWL